jgi:hypothetical protein
MYTGLKYLNRVRVRDQLFGTEIALTFEITGTQPSRFDSFDSMQLVNLGTNNKPILSNCGNLQHYQKERSSQIQLQNGDQHLHCVSEKNNATSSFHRGRSKCECR